MILIWAHLKSPRHTEQSQLGSTPRTGHETCCKNSFAEKHVENTSLLKIKESIYNTGTLSER